MFPFKSLMLILARSIGSVGIEVSGLGARGVWPPRLVAGGAGRGGVMGRDSMVGTDGGVIGLGGRGTDGGDRLLFAVSFAGTKLELEIIGLGLKAGDS